MPHNNDDLQTPTVLLLPMTDKLFKGMGSDIYLSFKGMNLTLSHSLL